MRSVKDCRNMDRFIRDWQDMIERCHKMYGSAESLPQLKKDMRERRLQLMKEFKSGKEI